MASGGSRLRSGPPPDPNALRRDRDKPGDWIDLPAAGRSGPPPEWPLSAATKRELELWAAEWKRPQAVMWEANGQELEVAMFVRAVRVAERPSSPTNARTLVLRQMDALGLTTAALQKNRWRIVAESQAPTRAGRSGSSTRERLKVVQGGA